MYNVNESLEHRPQSNFVCEDFYLKHFLFRCWEGVLSIATYQKTSLGFDNNAAPPATVPHIILLVIGRSVDGCGGRFLVLLLLLLLFYYYYSKRTQRNVAKPCRKGKKYFVKQGGIPLLTLEKICMNATVRQQNLVRFTFKLTFYCATLLY